MKTTTEENTVSRFESALSQCTTRQECGDALKATFADDDLLRQARERRTAYQKLKNERCKAIRRDELAPFEDQAKRFRKGQKVFFAKSLKSCALDWNFNFIKGADKEIEAGDWCRVWEYQPKAKRLWLCRPGTKCEYDNVIRDSFSLSDMLNHGISRTELALRK